MPPLTEERRLEQVKQVKRIGEENKVSIRSVRRDSNETLKKMEKEKIISQDEQKVTEANVQELTNRHIGQVDELVSAKEQELLND
jgi:ribosome recycling factor